MDIQLKRGVLDICILASLLKGDSYGYLILKDISEIMEMSESTLYQILRRLEKANNLETYSIVIDNRVRKYYKITNAGKDKIIKFQNEWKELIDIYRYISKCMEEKNE